MKQKLCDQESLLNRMLYWDPDIEYYPPQKESSSNNQVSIAALVSNRIYQGLKYEADIFLLTPETCENILPSLQPDFVLFESCRYSVTDDWYLAQTTNTEENNKLKDVLSYAKQLGIPTIYWFTEDHLYYNSYKSLLSSFDFIFCSDKRVIDLLNEDGFEAEFLAPAVQPAVYNGFKFYDGNNEGTHIGILFDGIVDLIRNGHDHELLEKLCNYDLKIIDSNSQIFSTKVNELPEFKRCILGSVTFQSRISALRFSNCIVTFESSQKTQLTQQWMAIEAAGCRVPIIFYGVLEKNDFRKQFVIEVHSETELIEIIEKINTNDIFREQQAHLAWRYVYSSHTYAHRLCSICKKINMEFNGEEFPLITMITPTYRFDMLDRIIETYDKQIYPNKELILIFNTNESTLPEGVDKVKNRDDVTILTLPQEYYTGACFNLGVMSAKGQYCFKVDDDDYYGEYYLYDYMLHTKSIDVDVFGKAPIFYHYEHDNKVFSKSIQKKRFMHVFENSFIETGNVWLGGNTISGKRSVLSLPLFPDTIFGAADSAFGHRAACLDIKISTMDFFNVVASRRADPNSHTWRIDHDVLRMAQKKEEISVDDLMI